MREPASAAESDAGAPPAAPASGDGGDPDPPHPGHAPRPKLSAQLRALVEDPGRARLSIGEMAEALGRRSFGALLLIFAAPNVLPTPPGTSAVLGAPLIVLAAQLMLGRPPWLPAWIAGRSMRREEAAALLERAMPWIERAERLLRPRLAPLVSAPAEAAVGALCLILALVLVLPIPLGNVLPALTICLFALGLLERDGLCVAAGAAMFAVSTVIAGAVAFAMVKAALFIATGAFAQ